MNNQDSFPTWLKKEISDYTKIRDGWKEHTDKWETYDLVIRQLTKTLETYFRQSEQPAGGDNQPANEQLQQSFSREDMIGLIMFCAEKEIYIFNTILDAAYNEGGALNTDQLLDNYLKQKGGKG